MRGGPLSRLRGWADFGLCAVELEDAGAEEGDVLEELHSLHLLVATADDGGVCDGLDGLCGGERATARGERRGEDGGEGGGFMWARPKMHFTAVACGDFFVWTCFFILFILLLFQSFFKKLM